MQNRQTYLSLYYHFVWTTKKRLPYITGGVKRHLYQYISLKCMELNAQVYAIGGLPDHVHLACSVPAAIAVSEFMNRINESSSHAVNQDHGLLERFEWQRGYGGLTFASNQLQYGVNYINNQPEHHLSSSTKEELEQTEQKLASASFLQT